MGVLVAQHEATWTLESQKEAIREVRNFVLAKPTPHLHTRDMEGMCNTLMVLRFLHDFEGCLEQLHCTRVGDALTGEPLDRWSVLELFCRPWVVTQGQGVVLLRLEEHVPVSLRALCALCSPWGLPFGALLAWVTLQSPSAFCRLHLRRIVGPRLVPCRVHLDSNYHVEHGGLCMEALAKVAASPVGICQVVKGAIPHFHFSAA